MNFAIVDYGAGNIANVKNAFDKLGADLTVSSSEVVWKNADALVFPGVGSFGYAMKQLGGKREALRQTIARGKPFLGICLGMQLLMDSSEESPGVSGLGLISGGVKRFGNILPVPQMGWNKVEQLKGPLFDGMSSFMAYFANSYYCAPADKSVSAATTDYGTRFVSAFSLANISALQFHPEKSGTAGLKVLQNFIREVKR